jgi:hypothetical protein
MHASMKNAFLPYGWVFPENDSSFEILTFWNRTGSFIIVRMPTPRSHGSLRGSDNPSRSSNRQGRFGRMFRSLEPATFDVADLKLLGDEMLRDKSQAGETIPDLSETPAGYTYFGQFISHDITFDMASSLERDNDPDALIDFRTPRFDLDSVYGQGPADQPYFYEKDGLHLLLGETLQNGKDYDVPRIESTERAIIGDPRNDENVIVSQMHAMFLRLHNRFTDELNASARAADEGSAPFSVVQRLVRWHYQWAVLHDFLPRIVDRETYLTVLPHISRKTNVIVDPPRCQFYKPRNSAYLPIEFSAAAFRFGHSTVRSSYQLNKDGSSGGPFLIFSKNPNTDLRSFMRYNRKWAIDWGLFFEGISQNSEAYPLQYARKIGTSLAPPLETVHLASGQDISLAERNLVRGLRLGLPSGQAVAMAMGIEAIPDDQLTVGPDKKPLKKVSLRFRENAPLWFYILAESETLTKGQTLGPVGSRIVTETIVGLLMEDSHSFLRQNPLWKPKGRSGANYDMTDLLTTAIGSRIAVAG